MNAAAYLRTAERNRRADEARHDQSFQRQFERSFESRDLADSRASRAGASDGGRAAEQIRSFEARRDAAWYERRIRSAAAHLPRGSLKRLLWAIHRNAGDRGKSIDETGKSEGWYRWGLKKLLMHFLGQ